MLINYLVSHRLCNQGVSFPENEFYQQCDVRTFYLVLLWYVLWSFLETNSAA